MVRSLESSDPFWLDEVGSFGTIGMGARTSPSFDSTSLDAAVRAPRAFENQMLPSESRLASPGHPPPI